ncbi:NADPH-dependent FMN reductase [Nocardioides sp. SYSU D00038]|uniref:NADPH-dependent FMN reductase n=1 Tax=Nocardioides sp. SYSU D00038 TaxID=2812554 RepID=UPI0019671CCC|nr:NAD(P)H-dependent oxidoreductase [Nocardioides sp. SYSU D00038]
MTSPARVAVVVGNPKPASRTLGAAVHVARELAGREPDLVVDLGTLGAALLDWSDPTVAGLVAEVGAADLVVVACPTYKATYTGLLKLFLDRFAGGTGLSGLAVPLMLGAGPAHALAPELTLRPVLAELGATTLRGHYVVDSAVTDPAAYDAWLAAVRPFVTAHLDRTGAPA